MSDPYAPKELKRRPEDKKLPGWIKKRRAWVDESSKRWLFEHRDDSFWRSFYEADKRRCEGAAAGTVPGGVPGVLEDDGKPST